MAPSRSSPSKTLNTRKKRGKGQLTSRKKVTKGIAPVYRAKVRKEGKTQMEVARDREKSIDKYIRNKRRTKQSVWCAP